MANDNLIRSQWTLLHAIGVGGAGSAPSLADLTVLSGLGLIEEFRNVWRPTERGRLMIAMRQQI